MSDDVDRMVFTAEASAFGTLTRLGEETTPSESDFVTLVELVMDSRERFREQYWANELSIRDAHVLGIIMDEVTGAIDLETTVDWIVLWWFEHILRPDWILADT